MSAPRPSEADVEALTRMVPYEDGTGRVAVPHGHDARGPRPAGRPARAARDAEHEREVAALETLAADQTTKYIHATARAEAAERALADLRGEIKALADRMLAEATRGTLSGAAMRKAAADLRALLPRDDAAGAGGAG